MRRSPLHILLLLATLALALLGLVPAPEAQATTAAQVPAGAQVVASTQATATAHTAPPASGLSTQAETVAAVVSDVAILGFSRPAEFVAAYWQGAPLARVTLAFSSDGVRFGTPVDADRDDAEGGPDDGMTYGAVLAAGGAIAVRVTTDTPLSQLHLIAMVPASDLPSSVSAAASSVPASVVAAAAAAAGEGPTVISRAAWGASPAYLNWAPRFYPAKKVIIHHTADGSSPSGTAESYAKLMRSIYYYHAVTRDWGDIAYNFLIDPLGNIYEGRYSDDDPATTPGEDIYGNGVVGGHTYNYNTATVGIAVLGTYSSRDISPAARASLEELVAWVVKRHGIDPLGSGPYSSASNPASTLSTWNITGHRDYGSTDCPGQAFYDTLPSLRQRVAELAGPVTVPASSPTFLQLSVSASPAVVGTELRVSATLLEEPSRKPLAGRTVSFATGGIAATQTALGTAKTDANGVATLRMTFRAVGMRWVAAAFDPVTDPGLRGSTTSVGVGVAPSGLAAKAGRAKVQLTWNSASEAAGYNVYRDGAKVNSKLITAATYTDTGLSAGVSYSYQVAAVVGGHEGAKSPAVSAVPAALEFTDVPAAHPYRQAILALAQAGVVSGKTETEFRPDDPVMRQQFAKMIVLGCEYPASENDLCRFKDVTKSGAASLYPDNYVAVCAARGITTGKTSTTFDPYSSITRAQVASMVVRAAEGYKPAAVKDPPAGWKGTLPTSDPTHGANIARAEYNGLLAGIDLGAFSVKGNATRGEIAQIIANLRQK